MNLFVFLFFIIAVSGMKFSEQNTFFDDYCSLRKSNAIKGIFVMLIFFSHGMDYMEIGDGDIWVLEMSEYLKQHIVVPFLFFSGFGIMESIQKKGLGYIKQIPVMRALRTMIFADIAVITFAIYYLIIGSELSLKQFLLSLVFWNKIENNTWYFFVIICLYLFTYISFRFLHKTPFLAALCTTVLSSSLFFILIETKSIIWYNTFFCYHFGMWYSLLRSRIEPIVMKNDMIYLLCMLLAFLGFFLFRHFGSFYYFIICGCWLMTLIIGLMMKISIDNPFLQFLGKHVLGFYVFHRLPMSIVAESGWENGYKFIFSFLVTAILVLVHERITKLIDTHLFLRTANIGRQ